MPIGPNNYQAAWLVKGVHAKRVIAWKNTVNASMQELSVHIYVTAKAAWMEDRTLTKNEKNSNSNYYSKKY